MTTPTAHLPAPSRSLADYYHWEETGKGIRIFMHAAMADRLQAEVLSAAAPDSGKEVGGILLGGTAEHDGKPAAFIDDFVPVPSGYSRGNLYDLTERDIDRLEAVLLRVALAGCKAPKTPAILGYYRSHMREGLSLSPSDVRAIEGFFPSPAAVFLVVKAAPATKSCTAGFFFWEDGSIQPEFSSLEVALGRTEVATQLAPPLPSLNAASEPAKSDDTGLFQIPDFAELQQEPAFEPIAPTSPPAYAPAEPKRQPARLWPNLLLRVATIAIATVALVVSVVTYLGAQRAPHGEAAAAGSAPSLLGLQVERNPPDLLMTWNRNSGEIASAARATLTIRDGKSQKAIELDRSELKLGSYLYPRAGDDIQVRLEVYAADGNSISQSVRTIAQPPSASTRQ